MDKVTDERLKEIRDTYHGSIKAMAIELLEHRRHEAFINATLYDVPTGRKFRLSESNEE